jgi:hypothetical protein
VKRILANWYYVRKDLTKQFLELSNDAEIIFIDKFSKLQANSEDEFPSENIKVVYWEDYNSPYELLKCTNPDLVIFYDIEAFNQIALNIAAKNLGIRTYVLQHGLRGGYEVEEAIQISDNSYKVRFSSSSFWSLRFLLSAIRLRNLFELYPLLKFMCDRKRFELTKALFKNKFGLRLADKYIEFSKENASYHKMRDGIDDSKFIFIGNPSYDEFFNIKSSPVSSKEPYALLIDNPFCEATFVQFKRMSLEEKNGYIQGMNKICLNKNLKLFVKLHPLSYDADYLIEDKNITYLKIVDLPSTISNAEFIFIVHFATLTPLAMSLRPFYFFENPYIDHNDFIRRQNIKTYDLLNFDYDYLSNELPTSVLLGSQLEDYLFKTDGKAFKRLKQILLS